MLLIILCAPLAVGAFFSAALWGFSRAERDSRAELFFMLFAAVLLVVALVLAALGGADIAFSSEARP